MTIIFLNVCTECFKLSSLRSIYDILDHMATSGSGRRDNYLYIICLLLRQNVALFSRDCWYMRCGSDPNPVLPTDSQSHLGRRLVDKIIEDRMLGDKLDSRQMSPLALLAHQISRDSDKRFPSPSYCGWKLGHILGGLAFCAISFKHFPKLLVA